MCHCNVEQLDNLFEFERGHDWKHERQYLDDFVRNFRIELGLHSRHFERIDFRLRIVFIGNFDVLDVLDGIDRIDERNFQHVECVECVEFVEHIERFHDDGNYGFRRFVGLFDDGFRFVWLIGHVFDERYFDALVHDGLDIGCRNDRDERLQIDQRRLQLQLGRRCRRVAGIDLGGARRDTTQARAALTTSLSEPGSVQSARRCSARARTAAFVARVRRGPRRDASPLEPRPHHLVRALADRRQ